ncbi:MAG TPA: hypothetical protein VH678_14300 [Xanthobacteraceae bacterium]|jgi:hypothetical protein
MRKTTVADLYRRFEAAHAAMMAVPSPDKKAYRYRVSRCYRLAERICVTPATTLDEMVLKTKAGIFSSRGADHLAELDKLKGKIAALSVGDELTCLASLRDDLQRMKASLRPK